MRCLMRNFVLASILFVMSGVSVLHAQTVTNPSFEMGLTGWVVVPNNTGFGETITVTAGSASNGTQKAEFDVPNQTGTNGALYKTQTIQSSTFNATAGSNVTFDWKVKRGFDDPWARAELFDSTGTLVYTFFKQSYSVDNAWTTASYTVVTTGNYYLEFQGGAYDASMGTLLGGKFFVDNINGSPSAPGVTITESGGSTNVAEGGATDTYTVVLNMAPTANVTITLNPGTQLTVVPSTLTFTPANWNAPQTVTVTAIDDLIIEGPHSGTITHTATSTDLTYNAIAIANVVASITDNDFPPPPPPAPDSEGRHALSLGPHNVPIRPGEGTFGFGGGMQRQPILKGPYPLAGGAYVVNAIDRVVDLSVESPSPPSTTGLWIAAAVGLLIGGVALVVRKQ